MTLLTNNKTNEIRQESGLTNLGYGPLRIAMCEGIGWITSGDTDMIIGDGEQIVLKASSHPILISSPHGSNLPIVFKVEQATKNYEGVQSKSSNFGWKTLFNNMMNLLPAK